MSRKRANVAVIEEAERDALVARCNLMGWPVTDYWLRRARSPRLETEAGRVIERMSKNMAERERDELGEVIEHMRRVMTRYLRAIDAPNPNPQNAAILVLPERDDAGLVEQAYSGPLTEGDESEEYRRAMAAYRNLQRWMRDLEASERADLVRAVYADSAPRNARGMVRALGAIGRKLRGERRPARRRDVESFTKGEAAC